MRDVRLARLLELAEWGLYGINLGCILRIWNGEKILRQVQG